MWAGGYYHYTIIRPPVLDPPYEENTNVIPVGEALQCFRQLLAVCAVSFDYKSTCKSAVPNVFRV